MLYKLNIDKPITIKDQDKDQDQNQDPPKSFKQDTRDLMDTDVDNVLGNIFEEF